MGPNKLFDLTTQVIEANMDRRVTRHKLISRNLANVDTPHYEATGLEFEKQLRTALDGGVMPASVSRTHPMHMPTPDSKPLAHAEPKYKKTGAVHLDIEMSKLAENNLMFNAMIQLLNKKMSVLKTAIADSGGGR
jgi:flagellar basal-body rod protein FlgB